MSIFNIVCLLFLVNKVKSLNIIDQLTPYSCDIKNKISNLGLHKTFYYADLVNLSRYSYMTPQQSKCILTGDFMVSEVIKECIQQLTINNNTIPNKVAQGKSLNDDNHWVSSCSPGMPCINCNKFAFNGSVAKLMKRCQAEETWSLLIENRYFQESSFLGFTQCQQYNPQLCIYPEKKKDTNTSIVYACPVSKNIYVANFMLMYILSPVIAARMPSCRIPYYNNTPP